MSTTRRTLLALVAGAAIASAPAVAQDQQPTELQVQSLWQAGSINQKVFERFAENVKNASGGRLVITPLPGLVLPNAGVQAGRHKRAGHGRIPAHLRAARGDAGGAGILPGAAAGHLGQP